MAAVVVEGLSKVYRLGQPHDLPHDTLRDLLAGLARRPRRARTPGLEHWALRDVSFEVAEGEAVGIIGRNGAGKSTLLKLLSRIAEPTRGRALLRGRVASLLEVGTGFHPELTGRENIHLSGTILGMRRAEIRRHFDAIVEFAEVEEFIDTPVKRYSSGMYVRLAFAVAAHMTPEILIVDEVLAVGDHEFQRRCLGRMSEVAHSGRTVLFVSHNMAAVETLCSRSLLLREGRIDQIGATRDVVARYLSAAPSMSNWDTRAGLEREGTGNARIVKVALLASEEDRPLAEIRFRQSFRLRFHYSAGRRLPGARFGFALLSERGERVFQTDTHETGNALAVGEGEGTVDCVVQEPNLLPGRYLLEAWIVEQADVSFADHLYCFGQVDIRVDPARSEQLAHLATPGRGRVWMDCRWKATETEHAEP
jgi:lipopolysaccharide transport system ATP-binding protein